MDEQVQQPLQSDACEMGGGAAVPATGLDSQPVAKIQGQPLVKLPDDLYIPPDALEVFLETFEGPLDLLLYLIRRQDLEILDIPIAMVTRQYIEYISLMQDMRLELAAEYLVMAAILAEIKSRMLLPKPPCEDEEDDPRAELVRRLQEYEQFREAAQRLDALPRMDRDHHLAFASAETIERPVVLPEVALGDLMAAMGAVLARAERYRHHTIQREPLSVRERMSRVLERVGQESFTEFTHLLDSGEGRPGVIVTMLAILELTREKLIEITQNAPFGPIYIRSAGAGAGAGE